MHANIKRSFSVILICSILIFNTGCQSVRQIHERLIVQGIGIDKIAENYIVCVQTFDANSSPIDAKGKTNSDVITSQGSSVLDALNSITNQNGKEPLYSQNLMIIIGNDTAASGIEDILDFFVRHYETRPTVNIFISKTSAYDIMHCKTSSGSISCKDIANLSKTSSNSNVLPSNVLNFVGDLQSEIKDPQTVSLSISGNEEDKIIIADGIAVFNHDKLSGYLDNEQTKGIFLLTGKINNTIEVLNIPQIGNITYSLTKSSNKINVDFTNGLPNFNINIKANANIYEIDKSLNTKISYEQLDTIKNAIEQKIKSIVLESIKTTLFDYNSDIFNFGKIILSQHPNDFKQINSNIKSTLINSSYYVTVNVKIKQTGKEGAPI